MKLFLFAWKSSKKIVVYIHLFIIFFIDHEYIKNAKEKFPAMKENVLQNGDSSPTAEDFKSLYILHNSRCSW